ncbi:NAD-dependent epimerase/dehydratase family protein [Algoriphagus confluentis]|uniref:NAD-dependent epimerase/dehydratase family protein n=1 Tax=Algoriphagus confluentis TaxID=1697556 RepID=A0ABQ6PR81_9BACT|nr:NAD-dependent epimerase/dehydratase family protein [Algoriphagus confluentis]
MNILITGITGLYGSFLAREFSKLGKIHGLKRKDSKLDLLESLDFEIHWHEGDVRDMESLLSAIRGMDLVIHAAGMVSLHPGEKEGLYAINTQGTAHLVNAMLLEGVGRLLHVSSVAAIGRSQELNVLDENFKWVESPLNTDYAISKYWGELEVWRGQQEGLEVMVLNPSILIGKVDHHRSSTAILEYVINRNKFYPKGDLNYIDVRDAARLARLLVEKEAWGERFILNKESIAYRDFFVKVAEILSLSAPFIPISRKWAGFASFFNRMLKALGIRKSLLNSQTIRIAQQKIFFTNEKVQELLDFRYHSLEDSIRWATKKEK